ncbi:sugar phosphate isomerase/epimerase family protein [Vibrio sp. WXL103]|uniref:sugar phosphate isomerase/epimerase family protein n=1 Tax=unclassified Vibrio TaxID=2614977 RepID=UPI003EC7D7C7
MKFGCFAAVQPFGVMENQLHAIKALGVDYADITDNHNGGALGVEFGFNPSVSLDSHPASLRAMAERAGVTLTSVCAHANLLDPESPELYSTYEVIRAVKLAHFMGIKHVITTEGDAKTEFGKNLTDEQALFLIEEKLHTPVRWAKELGVKLLLEPHGFVTDNVDAMEELLHRLGHKDHVGICLDTGNSWLGGSNPVDFVKRFGSRIEHVHWKDLGEEMIPQRGKMFGCGMAPIAIGEGVIDVKAVVSALKRVGFDGHTTLEVFGEENVRNSIETLKQYVSG